MVVIFTCAILTFIMMFIIPEFRSMFEEFEIDLPPMTELLIAISNRVVKLWFLFPLVPIAIVS